MPSQTPKERRFERELFLRGIGLSLDDVNNNLSQLWRPDAKLLGLYVDGVSSREIADMTTRVISHAGVLKRCKDLARLLVVGPPKSIESWTRLEGCWQCAKSKRSIYKPFLVDWCNDALRPEKTVYIFYGRFAARTSHGKGVDLCECLSEFAVPYRGWRMSHVVDRRFGIHFGEVGQQELVRAITIAFSRRKSNAFPMAYTPPLTAHLGGVYEIVVFATSGDTCTYCIRQLQE